MKSALADFRAGIDQLLIFLDRTEYEQELIGLLNERKRDLPTLETELLNHLIGTATNTKQYIYTVAIVSLYGLLECLVDNLVIGFVIQLGNFSRSFEQLPDVIRRNHLPYSLALADALLKDRFRAETTHEQVIANLHSCLSESTSFRLNGSAFALHRGNLNLNRITEMLGGIGVQQHLRRLVRISTFSHFIKEKAVDRDVLSLTDGELKSLFDPIDDLVERRNGVSHGVVQVDDIESVDLLKDRCAFVCAYGDGLFVLLQNDIIKHAAEVGVAQALGHPIKVYDHKIVCFEVACRIAVGDLLFALTSDNMEPVRSSAISCLQINRANQQEIVTDTPIQFGAQVSFYANDQYDYYSLPADRL
jgi:hypothetical protein